MKTIFERLEDCGITVDRSIQLCDNFAVFDFESITVPQDDLKNTESTTWIGKHVPISVSISSTLEDDPIFLCDSDVDKLIEDFVQRLEELSSLNAALMYERLDPVFSLLCNKLDEVESVLPEKDDKGEHEETTSSLLDDQCIDGDTEDKDDMDPHLKFLLQQRTILSRLRDDLRDYCETLIVFGFNSSRYDLNLIKEPLLKYLLFSRNVEPKSIRKSNQFVSMKFLGLQFLDILNFIGGSTSLDKFLKAYGVEESKGYFPYEWFDTVDKLEETDIPSAECFFNKLKNCNVLSVEHDEFMRHRQMGLSEDDALKKMKIRKIPNTMEENYADLKEIWLQHGMTSFRDYLQWYNNKDVVPTKEAIRRMMLFYHAKNIDMLKLGCTLPNLANTFLHKSTSDKFFPFTEKDKDYDSYIRSWLTGGPSIIFNRYAKAGETRIDDSEHVCKTILGIDASQLYPFAMTKDMPTGLYTKWEFDQATMMYHPKRNTQSFFEYQVINYLQHKHPDCTIESNFTTGKQKCFASFRVDGYCSHCNTVFEAMGCYYHFCPCQEKKRQPIEVLEEGLKRREMGVYRRNFLESLGLKVVEVWECEWRAAIKNKTSDERAFVSSFSPFNPPMKKETLIQKIRQQSIFGVIDCSLRVPDHLKEKFARFPPIFKNVDVGRDDIGDHMRNYAIENDLLKKPRRMLISSFSLKRGPIITPLLNFYIDQGLVLEDVHWFLQYNPRKSFGSFVQSVVSARRDGDRNQESTVVAETMKLIGNSSYGYQIMDRSRHTDTKYVVGSKVDRLINSKYFKELHELPSGIFETEMLKKEVVHREPIIIGFFILQYAKLTMLELYYNFFDKFCDRSKFELIEMDTDSLYMAIAGDTIEDIIRPEMMEEWRRQRQQDCRDNFEADGIMNFFPRNCCHQHNRFDQRTPGLFKEEFRCTEMVALCSKTYCCYCSITNALKLSSKGLNHSSIINDNPMEKYLMVMNTKEKIITCNRGFRVMTNRAVYTYELRKSGLSYFYPKRKVRDDGIHTDPLDI